MWPWVQVPHSARWRPINFQPTCPSFSACTEKGDDLTSSVDKVQTYKLSANMPEWSKGGDLRSPVFVRVGSNPTVGKVETFILTVNMPEWSKGDDLRSSVFVRVGSNPTVDKVETYKLSVNV